MNNHTKILSVFLALLLAVGAVTVTPLSASAAEAEAAPTAATIDQAYPVFEYYVLGDGTAEISRYLGAGGDVTIPSTLGGHTVTSIGRSVFYGCTSLTSIDIPDSVTSIGWFAFFDCTGLTSITIPDSVTRIDANAFDSCTGLANIDIPNSVTSIGYKAFAGCTGLTSVTIPDSVTSIYYSAFSGCTSLKSIKVTDGNNVYDSRDNCDAIIETETNSLVVGCKTTVIPGSVTSIGESAFEGCKGLMSIDIPDSVTSIDYSAFDGCAGLTSVTIPDSVTSIRGTAFSGCTALMSVKVADGNNVYDSRDNCNAIIETESNTLVIGCINTVISDSVVSIGRSAFYACTGLTSIDIPGSVTSIDSYAFFGCTGLTNVTIPESVTDIRAVAFGYYYEDGLSEMNVFDKSKVEGFTVCGAHGSAAEVYAYQNGFDFVATASIPIEAFTEVMIDEPAMVKAESSTGTAYFKFTPEEDIEFVARSGVAGHTWGYLYDEDMNLIAYRDGTDYGDDLEPNYRIRYTASAGKTLYFIVGYYLYWSVSTAFKAITISQYHEWDCKVLDDDTAQIVKYNGDDSHVVIPASIDGHTVTSIDRFAFYFSCHDQKSVTIPDSVTYIGDRGVGYCVADWYHNYDFIIYGAEGSEAERYAVDNDFKFVPIKSTPDEATPDESTPDEATPDEAILGDVDSDGEVTVNDATYIQRKIADIAIPFEIDDAVADADQDGQVTLMDATYIQRWLIKLKSNDNIGDILSAFDSDSYIINVSGKDFCYYDQTQCDYPYGDDTIAYSGSAPACFAMIASTIKKKSITPVEAVEWCGNDYYVYGIGTMWSYFEAAADHFGIGFEGQTGDIGEAVTALKKGKYVISSHGPGRFTKGGHFIVMAGVDTDGNIIVCDPNGTNNYVGTPFTVDEIDESATSFWIFDKKYK